MKKYIFYTCILGMIMFTTCSDLEVPPYTGLAPEDVEAFPEGLDASLRGVYSFLKEHPFPRAYHLGFEYNSDDIMMMQTSGSHSFFYYNYKHITSSSYVTSFYQDSYKAIHQANEIYASLPENGTAVQNQVKGEALFVRTLLHLALTLTHGRPYNQNPETNLGIIYMHAPSTEINLRRNTVKECYDWIVRDFLEAADLMTLSKNNNYGSREAAWALLARVYLYMENNSKAIEYAEKVINSGRYSLVDGDDLAQTPVWPPEQNTETIFAFKTSKSDEPNRSWIGAKYYLSPEGVGRGSISVAAPLREVLFRHIDDDKRVLAYTDPRYEKAVDGTDSLDTEGNKVWQLLNGYPVHYILKFSNQYGLVLSCSAVIVRLAEMYLIRAEANAKLGGAVNEQAALDDVNLLRQRAGLSGDALFTLTDLKEFDNVLDVVLGERRIELMFEGHRSIDLWRNGKTMDRSYPGSHLDGGDGLTEIPPDHPYVIQFIPEDETLLNPNLVQNPGL